MRKAWVGLGAHFTLDCAPVRALQFCRYAVLKLKVFQYTTRYKPGSYMTTLGYPASSLQLKLCL